jgi:hypothetical protein
MASQAALGRTFLDLGVRGKMGGAELDGNRPMALLGFSEIEQPAAMLVLFLGHFHEHLGGGRVGVH